MPSNLRDFATRDIEGPMGPTGPGGNDQDLKVISMTVTDGAYDQLRTNSVVDSTGGHIKLSGENFSAGAKVYFGNTEATTVTVASSTQLNVAVPALTAGVYNIYVENSNGATVVKPASLLSKTPPSWTTGSSLGSFGSSVPFSLPLVATGGSGSTVTYSVDPSSSLPAGVTLTSAGLLSGSVTDTFQVVVRATNEFEQYATRTFTLTITTYEYLVKMYGLSTGSEFAFTDSSAYAHTVTNSNNVIVGNSTAKHGGNSIFIGNNNGASNLRVSIAARGINFTSSSWTLGYWFLAANDAIHYTVGFETSANKLIFGTAPAYYASPTASSFQNVWWSSTDTEYSSGTNIGTGAFSGSWYFIQQHHDAGTTIINKKIFNASGILVSEHNTDWTNWTATLSWAYVNQTIDKIRINFSNTNTTYGRIDSLYFSSGGGIPPIPTAEPF